MSLFVHHEPQAAVFYSSGTVLREWPFSANTAFTNARRLGSSVKPGDERHVTTTHQPFSSRNDTARCVRRERATSLEKVRNCFLFIFQHSMTELDIHHNRERDLHVAPLVTVLAGRPPRTRCWIRLCVLEPRSRVASFPRASRTKQGRFRPVSEIWPICYPISPAATLGDEPRAVA